MATYKVIRGPQTGAVLSEGDFIHTRRIHQMLDARQLERVDDAPAGLDNAPTLVRMTVREIAAAVNELDAATVRVMLEGEDRQTAREMLSRRLEALT